MPPIKKISDKLELVPTKSFPYGYFSFESFNRVQSAAFDIYQKDCNLVVAAPTGCGKSGIAELFIASEVRERKGKAIYLAPMKALANEKMQDWTDPNHHFSDLRLSICSGDFKLTAERKKELSEADILVFTSEMLNSRCRNFKSENNEFLKDVGTIIVDEAHLLTVPGRGDHLEVGLMKLTEINPNVRFILLSATMPNVSDIAEWVSYYLNKKETYLLESKWRPCPLGIHYETYTPQGKSYEVNEEEKVLKAIQIIEDYKEDKFLLFVHTKRTGEMAKKMLTKLGYACEFHSADLNREQRTKLETKFRSGNLHILIATSTVAWGCNLPARRVIIAGVHRGVQLVETYDIWQMVGRSGRPGYDPRGDAYILIPENSASEHMERLQEHSLIQSKLLDHIGDSEQAHYKNLAFHLVSEIHHGFIKNKEDVHTWFGRSLAYFQTKELSDKIVDSTMDLLLKCGAITIVDGIFKVTAIGMISSMFYYSPFDVSDLRRNFKVLFENDYQDNDLVASMALANIDSVRMGIVSKSDKAEMLSYQKKIEQIFDYGTFNDAAIKGGFLYYGLLNGVNSEIINASARTYQFDFPRLGQVLSALDTMSGKWNKKLWIKDLTTRIAYGVRKELIPLVSLESVGKVRAERLYEMGIKTPQDVVLNKARLSSILNTSQERVDKIIESVKHDQK